VPGWRAWGATGLGLVALFVFLALVPGGAADGPVLCLFRRATGVACPACGLTRAAALAARGCFAESFALHPALALLAAEALGGWLLWAHRLRGGRRFAGWGPPVLVATAVALVALWIVRLFAGDLPP
jgi:hypothetical protein